MDIRIWKLRWVNADGPEKLWDDAASNRFPGKWTGD